MVRQQGGEPFLQIQVNGHGARESFPEQRHQIARELIEIDGGELDLRPAAESEDLAHEAAGTLCRAMDLPEALLQDGDLRLALLAELRIPINDGEQVVEIVRDAAGERAQAL